MYAKHLASLLLPKSIIEDFDEVRSVTVRKSVSFKEPNIETLVLVPSERCNLSCSYCYEHHKQSRRMSVQTAKDAIRVAFDSLSPCKRLKIEFRGGEPFLEFGFVREVCDWVVSEYPHDRYFFYAITNGTCFTDEVKCWLQKHSECFVVPLSIDGGRVTHNRNRSNSFDLIDFDFLFETWERPFCIATILPENAHVVSQDLQFLMDKGFDVRVNFGYLQEWTSDQLLLLAEEFKRFADHTLGRRYTNRINLLSRSSFLDYSFPLDKKDEESRGRFLSCNAGRSRRLIAADGQAYPCQAFVPSAFGWSSESSKGDMFARLRTETIQPKMCCACSFLYLCHICPGFSYGHARNFKWRNPSLCAITRIRTFLALYYWGCRLLDGSNMTLLSKQDVLETMAAIAEVYHGEKIYA